MKAEEGALINLQARPRQCPASRGNETADTARHRSARDDRSVEGMDSKGVGASHRTWEGGELAPEDPLEGERRQRHGADDGKDEGRIEAR